LFKLILDVFYVFRTSRVHHQEDHLYMQFNGTFFMHLFKESSRWYVALDTVLQFYLQGWVSSLMNKFNVKDTAALSVRKLAMSG
jgi:hypothetical protein